MAIKPARKAMQKGVIRKFRGYPNLHLLSFRVYPAKLHKPWFRVYVWETKQKLWGYLRAAKIDHQNCLGICCGYEAVKIGPRGGVKTIPELGMIHFVKGCLGVGTISHECTHAALRFADWKKLDHRKSMKRHEEPICWAQGNMVRQVCSRFWKAGYYTKK